MPPAESSANQLQFHTQLEQATRLDTLQKVELAEGVEIHLRMAGPYVRVLAYALDFLIRVGVLILVGLVLMLVSFLFGMKIAQGIQMLVMFGLTFFYYVIFEAGKRGASPGKRMMGLRVVDTSGAPISFGQSFIRNMLRFADMLPGFYACGLACTLLTKRFQRLGDLLANTVVVYDKVPVVHVAGLSPTLKSLAPGVALTREEQAAILGFRERAGTWSEARRVELSDHAGFLTKSEGEKGMTRLLGMAHWLADKS
ncbi:MAG: RDD family protein [Akkermansiaceae bacterium]